MDKETKFFLNKLRLPLLFCFIMLFCLLIEKYLGFKLTYYGIYPRSFDGLLGIIFSPFLHSGWSHFLSNLVPVFVLVTMMEVFYERVSLLSIVSITLITGIAVWMFARNSYHIGASGLIYGLISFIFWTGLFRVNTRSIILSLIILVVYSSYFDGLKPREGVSWESHLFGALSGILMSFLLKNLKEKDELLEEVKLESEPKKHFFSEDVFSMTKEERHLLKMEEERIAKMLSDQIEKNNQTKDDESN